MARLVGIVEDNDIDFYTLRRGLGAIAELERWTRGEDLIAAILRGPETLARLDLLLLDLTLPGIDGVHLAHTIRTSPGGHELPIVMLTGSDDPQSISRATAADVAAYEIKPRNRAQLSDLAQRITDLLEPGT